MRAFYGTLLITAMLLSGSLAYAASPSDEIQGRIDELTKEISRNEARKLKWQQEVRDLRDGLVDAKDERYKNGSCDCTTPKADCYTSDFQLAGLDPDKVRSTPQGRQNSCFSIYHGHPTLQRIGMGCGVAIRNCPKVIIAMDIEGGEAEIKRITAEIADDRKSLEDAKKDLTDIQKCVATTIRGLDQAKGASSSTLLPPEVIAEKREKLKALVGSKTAEEMSAKEVSDAILK